MFGGDVVMVVIECVIIYGIFEFDGGSWEVDNNIWLVGDDFEVVVFDVVYYVVFIIDVVGGCKVVVVICMYGYNDYVMVVFELGMVFDVLVLMYFGDVVLW